MGARHTLECLCSLQTNDIDVAADVQKGHQRATQHGPAVCGRGQFMAFAKYSWHFGQRYAMRAFAAPLL
eukprot:3161832-Pyramimonas_sp.AAC.1